MIGFYYSYDYNNEQSMPSAKCYDNNDDESIKKKIMCKIDQLDEDLYKLCFRNKSCREVVHEGSLQKPYYRFYERECIETKKFEEVYYNNWVLLSERKEIKNGTLKKKLVKVFHKQKPKQKEKRNRQIIINDDTINKFPEKIIKLFYGNLLSYIPEDYESKNLLQKPKFVGFKPINFDDEKEFNSSISMVQANDKEIKGIDDSLFKDDEDSEDEKNGRPSYMKHLFRRHNFHVDIDPWKGNDGAKTQTKTACLSVINDVFKTFTKK